MRIQYVYANSGCIGSEDHEHSLSEIIEYAPGQVSQLEFTIKIQESCESKDEFQNKSIYFQIQSYMIQFEFTFLI